MNWMIAIILLVIILGFAYQKKSLTLLGTLIAFIMGIIIFYAGGFIFLITLFSFFISSSVLTKIGARVKDPLEKKLYSKTGCRDAFQVLANGLIPTICAILYLYYNQSNFWYIAYFIALAVSTADTWASEIGLLSKKQVYSPLTYKIVPKGISGGITLLGVFASILGATFIALLYSFTNNFNFAYFLLIILCGTLGAYFDSVLGELVQVKYKDSSGELTEIVSNNQKVKGVTFIDNDMINFLSSIIGVCIFGVIYNLV